MLAVTTMFWFGSFVMTTSYRERTFRVKHALVGLTIHRAVGVAGGGRRQHLHIGLTDRGRSDERRGGADVGEESSRELHLDYE